jgi:hypothetical protein
MDPGVINRRVEEEFRCDHPSAHLTRFVCKNGTIHFRMQCRRCGETTKTFRRVELTPAQMDAAPEHDAALNEGWRRRRWDRYAQLRAEAEAEEKEGWDAWYASYLQTPEWKRRHALVMDRAKGMCEGCSTRRAVQVHHLTYARAGEEMLFDLVAVCRECHEKIHADKIG